MTPFFYHCRWYYTAVLQLHNELQWDTDIESPHTSLFPLHPVCKDCFSAWAFPGVLWVCPKSSVTEMPRLVLLQKLWLQYRAYIWQIQVHLTNYPLLEMHASTSTHICQTSATSMSKITTNTSKTPHIRPTSYTVLLWRHFTLWSHFHKCQS